MGGAKDLTRAKVSTLFLGVMLVRVIPSAMEARMMSSLSTLPSPMMRSTELRVKTRMLSLSLVR